MSTEKELINLALQALVAGNGAETELFLMEAYEMGSRAAAHNLGVLYKTGAPGVASSHEKFQHWLNISLESGFEAAVASDPTWFKSKMQEVQAC